MDYGAKGIEGSAATEVFLRACDGADNSAAEAGAGVYLYLYHVIPGLSRRVNLP